jgi:hypothetical protein
MHHHPNQHTERFEIRRVARWGGLLSACLIAASCAGQHEVQRREPTARERELHREARQERAVARAERAGEPIPADTTLVRDETDARLVTPSARENIGVKPVAIATVDDGNTAADRELSQRIRKSIVADDKLSLNAKNVRIVSNDREVTLSGPVTTAEESSRVESHAQHAAGSRHVNNQLEITK